MSNNFAFHTVLSQWTENKIKAIDMQKTNNKTNDQKHTKYEKAHH